ncbi:lysophospholipase [Brevibacillus borstelensis]|uniref:alpha/beta hydrolase n=1 Tax=Brevibacillus borstelensis TaxID=45462 RepID=UPI002E251223|nr:lysophospholipase [Brevibacillus borstelensis]
MEWFSHTWSVEKPRAAMVLIHGTGEHHGRYQHVADELNRFGVEVVTGDLPGWGRSAGRKGHIDSFSQYLDAAGAWVETALQKAGQKYPVFVLGHSMGGLVAVRLIERFAERKRLAGLILTSPCLQLKVPVPQWKARLAVWLDKSWPTLRMASGITPEMVTRDPEVQKAYITDPWQYPKVSVRWYQELHRAMGEAWEERGSLLLPTLVLQAGDDLLVDADAVERFAADLPEEAVFRRFPGMRHELLNEPEREDVLCCIVEWMKQHGLEM